MAVDNLSRITTDELKEISDEMSRVNLVENKRNTSQRNSSETICAKKEEN